MGVESALVVVVNGCSGRPGYPLSSLEDNLAFFLERICSPSRKTVGVDIPSLFGGLVASGQTSEIVGDVSLPGRRHSSLSWERVVEVHRAVLLPPISVWERSYDCGLVFAFRLLCVSSLSFVFFQPTADIRRYVRRTEVL